MTQWNFDNPGAGSVSSMNSTIRVLANLQSQLGELRTLIHDHREIGGLSTTNWTGIGADTMRQRVVDIETEIEALATRLSEYEISLRTYVSAVNTIRDTHSPLAIQLESARANEQERKTAYNETIATYQYDTEIINAYMDAVEEIRKTESNIQSLLDDRESADSQLSISLEPESNATTFAALGQILIDNGCNQPCELTVDAIDEAIADLANTVLNGDNDAKMTELLGALSVDPERAAKLVEELGGARIAELLNLIGSAIQTGKLDEATGVDIALALRHAISIASQDWTQDEANAFINAMTNTPTSVEPMLIMLFSSPELDPMGETLSIAAADIIDQHYRTEQQSSWPKELDSLSWLADKLSGSVFENKTYSAQSLIFNTLANYPEASLKWLTAGNEGDTYPRIDYWYGGESAQNDGYGALSNLWASIQSCTPDTPESVGANTEIQTQLAKANTSIFNALTENENFLPENISDEARAGIAEVYGRLLPQLAICPIYVDGQIDGKITTFTLSDGTQLVFSSVKDAQVAEVMGVVAGTPYGAALMDKAITSAQDLVMSAALAGITYTADQALNFVNQTEQILQGSIAGAQEGIAAREQERIDAAVESLSTVLDLIPIPGGPADYLAGNLTKKLGETLAEKFASNLIDYTASEIDGALRDEILNGAVSSWHQSAGDVGVPEGASEIDLTEILTAWTIALSPPGLDVTNSYDVANYVDHIQAHNPEFLTAYQTYAAGSE